MLGSVVTKNIEPYAIFVGDKVRKYRFSEKIINKLEKVDYNMLEDERIKEKIDILYSTCTDTNIDELIKEVIK